ncbi:MAG: isochorismatase family protein [Actinobacteria bacterium]|nr:isochorismatase family protein [Actinomycetota bacterium]
MQVDFADGGAAEVPGTTVVVPRVARLAAGFRDRGLSIVHVVRLYLPGSADVDLPRRAQIMAAASIVAPGTPGSAVVPGLVGREHAGGARTRRRPTTDRGVGLVHRRDPRGCDPSRLTAS